ncbi:hypothetical protein BB559_006158 [Furculomyces boomerangus]|uniref:Uncharacterized protein n=1 Tax=Furculomyces boomerangus TaxID=61424 RepID=A0A2T9Y4F4_9FUNG|nr:hypothetical protein BB559_006158 [Furculomyces boomerangus]
MSTLKLGSLFIRTLTKPVSKQLKEYAKSSKTFKNICISVAQGSNELETEGIGVQERNNKTIKRCKGYDYSFDIRSRISSKKDKQNIENRLVELEATKKEFEDYKATSVARFQDMKKENDDMMEDMARLRNILSDILDQEMRPTKLTVNRKDLKSMAEKKRLLLIEKNLKLETLSNDQDSAPADSVYEHEKLMEEKRAKSINNRIGL